MDYWVTENIIDHASTAITPSSSAGELTAANLLDPRVGVKWRSADVAGGILNIALGGPTQLSAIGVFGVDDGDSLAGTEVRIKIGSTAGASNVLNWVGQTQHGQAVYRTPVIRDPDGTYRPTIIGAPYITITLPYAKEVGRVFAGTGGVYPQVGHTLNGSNWQMVDLSLRSITPRNGAFLIDIADRRRVFTAAYDALDPTELFAFDRLDRYTGTHRQVMFVPDPAVYDPISNWAVLGYIRELPENQFVGYMRGTRVTTIVEAG
jgi:hypothetical protein